MTDAINDLIGDDSMAFRFLSNAANAIVERSTLGKIVAAQASGLDHLREQVSIISERNDMLGAQLAETSRDLDQERTWKHQAEDWARQTKEELATAADRIDGLEFHLSETKINLARTTSERDDYIARNLELEAKLAAATKKLEKLSRIFEEPIEPEPHVETPRELLTAEEFKEHQEEVAAQNPPTPTDNEPMPTHIDFTTGGQEESNLTPFDIRAHHDHSF